MPHPQFPRDQLQIRPLRERRSKVAIERDHVPVDTPPTPLSASGQTVLDETVQRIRRARARGRPVMLAFGAHAVKNGLALVLQQLIAGGWVTHLATNGAGVIHDWEFAFQGESTEDVRAYVQEGQFGIWKETGFYHNLALIVGAYAGLGYGESIGAMIEQEALTIPSAEELQAVVHDRLDAEPDRAAAAADLYDVIRRFSLRPGRHLIPHPYKRFSIPAAAWRLNVPFTAHPMFGQDIIYTHPINQGAAIGRTALRDFLSFAHTVNELDGGVYLSVGSAIMSPMIFEKSLSMARNLHRQRGDPMTDLWIVVADLAPAAWDWQREGEPPLDHPAYYLRYAKTFSRMGGQMRYVCADNRDFLLTLSQSLARGPAS